MRGLLAAVLLALATAAGAQDATLERARQLIQGKQAEQAFQLLAPLEPERAGDPAYDYLLGLAAVDAGHLTRGVFALERVLAVQPNHPQARAEIARAYFVMKENKLAREEFEAVRRAKPPAEVQGTIDKFLDALDARERARGTGIAGFVEVGVGHDSNANAATSSTQFAIPLFPGLIFNLAPGAAEQSDEFMTLAAGVNGRYALNETVGLVGSVAFDQRLNESLTQFETGSVGGSGGVSIRQGASEFILAAQAQSYSVDYRRFRDATGIVGQWRQTIGQTDQVSAYYQHTRLSYPGQNARNTERNVLGAAWAHLYGGPRNPVVFAGAYAGSEDPLGTGVPHFGHDLWGVRLGGQMALTDKWTGSLSLSYEDRDYLGPDPLFLITRDDRELQFRAAATYAVNRNLSVIPAFQYTDNRSNIVVNDYQRTVVSVSVRYEFR